MNAIDGNVLHGAVCTEEALDVLVPKSEGRDVVSEKNLSI